MSLEKPWGGEKEMEGGEGARGQGNEAEGGAPAGEGAHLLLEVADGVLVGVGEEVEDVVLDVVLLQVVHQVRPIALGEPL